MVGYLAKMIEIEKIVRGCFVQVQCSLMRRRNNPGWPRAPHLLLQTRGPICRLLSLPHHEMPQWVLRLHSQAKLDANAQLVELGLLARTSYTFLAKFQVESTSCPLRVVMKMYTLTRRGESSLWREGHYGRK